MQILTLNYSGSVCVWSCVNLKQSQMDLPVYTCMCTYIYIYTHTYHTLHYITLHHIALHCIALYTYIHIYCMYIYMCVYTYMYAYVYIYICIHTYIYVDIYIYTPMPINIHVLPLGVRFAGLLASFVQLQTTDPGLRLIRWVCDRCTDG